MNKLILNLKKYYSNNMFFELIGTLIYTLILQLVYILIYESNEQWIFGYETNYNFIKAFFSYTIIVFLFINNEKTKSEFIKFLNKIFIFLMFIPISAIYCVRDFSTISYLVFVIEFTIIILGINFLDKLTLRKKVNTNNLSLKKLANLNFTNYIYAFFWIITIFVIACCIKYNGIPKFSALNLYNVYEIRDEFYLPKYIQYLYDFVTKFIILFLMVVNLHKKNYKIVGVTSIILLLFFLWKGDKFVLFSAPLVIAIYLALNKLDYKKYLEKNIIWLIVYASIGLIILHLINIKLPLSLFIRRVLLVPANLKFVYIDFFSNHEKIGILGTIFNFIFKIENPYSDLNYPYVISDIYFNKPEMFANTGFLIEGFIRWGYIGVIIIPIIYVIILKILDNGAKNTSFAFMVSMSIIPLISLNDGYLIPSLTFGAIGLLCFTSIFFKIDQLDTGKFLNKVILKLRRK